MMPDAERGELTRHVVTFGRGGGREALPEPAAARVDPQLAARLGIDQPEVADVRELLLARVANLDGDDAVP